VEIELQLSGLDSKFHDLHEKVQPLPFALMKDNYAVINGRGYPDTVNPNRLPPPTRDGVIMNATATNPAGTQSSVDTSLITARTGQKVLVRISVLNVTRGHTLMSPSIPMMVVGKDAKLLRGPTGANQYYKTNSISLGSGETADVLLDLAGVAPGTYFLYASELNHLSNYTEDFGGMMTEIVVTP
jgi:FtsP/CotA-like multicopper oxidase with cupredoxin domain